MVSLTLRTNWTPLDVLHALRERPHPFLLDSCAFGLPLGRYSFVGADPFLTFASEGDSSRIADSKGVTVHTGNPWEALQELLSVFSVPFVKNLPFSGGAVGYLGYEMGRFLERLPEQAFNDVAMPDCFFGLYNSLYAFDHLEHTVTLISHTIPHHAESQLASMQALLEGTPPPPVPSYVRSDRVLATSNISKQTYLEAIHRIREYIHAGDIYQANFTHRFQCPFDGDPLSLYTTLRERNPAPFAAYIDTGEGVVLSSSPERFLSLTEDTLETRPIKGTIARGAPEQEEAQRQTLLASEKDRAELLMIVDLERNDLSRVSHAGSVQVPELFAVETYATVHHLVATVTGQRLEAFQALDCVRAAFPGGSITGAPKIRAMEIIDELEPTCRKVYTGSIGYLGFDGGMDFNIAIRTILVHEGMAYAQVGGGIVWDSVPEAEYAESLLKAKALLQALQADVQES